MKSADFSPVNTLVGVHKVSVTLLRFEPPRDFDEAGDNERLASVDESGLVVIWAWCNFDISKLFHLTLKLSEWDW